MFDETVQFFFMAFPEHILHALHCSLPSASEYVLPLWHSTQSTGVLYGTELPHGTEGSCPLKQEGHSRHLYWSPDVELGFQWICPALHGNDSPDIHTYE